MQVERTSTSLYGQTLHSMKRNKANTERMDEAGVMLTVCTSHTLHTFIAFTSMVYRVYQKVSSYKDKIQTPCSIKYVSYICTLSYLHYTTTLTLQQLVYFVVVKHILHTIYITCVCTKNKNKKSTAMYIVCNQTSKLQTMLLP